MNNLACMPLLCCLLTGLAALLMYSNEYLQRIIHYLGAIGYLLIAIALFKQVQAMHLITLNVGGYPTGIAITLRLDIFSSLMILVTAITVLAVSIYSVADTTIRNRASFYPAFWFLVAGVTGIFSTGDLFNLYVWFEIMIIASFVLMTLSNENDRLKGTLHYISLNLLATLILLLAISFIYGASGTLDLNHLAKWAQTSPSFKQFYPCFIMLMVAFAIKAALFPYYFWLPASYHLTSVSAGSIFAGLLTKTGVYALIRMGTLLFSWESHFFFVLLIVSCLTMLSGVFGAMSDFHIRRILSFHIISQVGYMTLALALGTTMALSAGVFYIIHHILVKTNLFFIAGILSRYNHDVDIRQMGGIFKQKPLLTLLFIIPAFSLAGLPPFSGFWAKYLLLQSALTANFWITGVIIVLVGFFTLFSMIKLWRYVFLQPPLNPIHFLTLKEKAILYIPVFFLGTLTLLIGLFPEWLYEISQMAANGLLHPYTVPENTVGGI
ncbi:proton-conducting transporter membrane subunit [Legionella yabuuchiae]|uniref:proton-conducting transporter transmembrane domain-containing protein n=1 Tax=Legionella yabuuchiae TaxID=376727 RepID=UPI001055AF86|nr:proton-conducting transporter membrane subunit [Legionella yabuuchiae]